MSVDPKAVRKPSVPQFALHETHTNALFGNDEAALYRTDPYPPKTSPASAMKLRHLAVLFALLLPVAASAQNAAVQTALNHISERASSLGLSQQDVADLGVTDAYQSRRSGLSYVYVRQQHAGIGLVDANMTVSVQNGSVFHVAGEFEIGIADRIESTSPAVSAADAAQALALEMGLTPTSAFTVIDSEGGPSQAVTLSDGGVALEPIPARLVYHMDEDDNLYLTWLIGIYENSAQHYWNGRVDAQTGEVLRSDDLVVHDYFGFENTLSKNINADRTEAPVVHPMAPVAASVNDYRVFEEPVEAPIYASSPPPADGRTLQTNPADATASPFGWHDTNGASGNEFTRTRGNNVHAYTDVDANNSPDAGSDPDCGPSIICDFDFPINFGTDAPSTYRDAAVANLFYWNNYIHDVTSRHGFDSPSGNFQVNTYGTGGIGNDDVRAEAQDGSGTNNANFFTPSDGNRPRMQMFIGTNPNPDVDGDFDNLVIVHEYAHGISNRLVGGPANVGCLSHAEQAGEGWSDWYGLLMTIEPGDTGADPRGIGNYLFGQPTGGPGIRATRYSTNFAVNDRTHNDIGNSSRSGGHPHGTGYVWSTILWEATWELIDDFGFNPDLHDPSGTAGNQVMLSLVTEAMKMGGCNPGFVDNRDAILAAETAMYGDIHRQQLCDAFARRGLGDNATQGSVNSRTDNTDGFTPCVIPVELGSFNSTVDGNDVILSWNTHSETNNSGFEVQHWTSDTPLEVLGFAEGHGTTTEAQNYSFRATDLEPGSHTFRLKQIDFDGAYEYSAEVEVTVGVVGTHLLSEVYPNPFNPQAQFNLAVSSSQDVTIAVYDVMGRRVAMLHEGQLDANETYNFTVDGSNLASGAYFVRIAGETFAEARRITLLK